MYPTQLGNFTQVVIPPTTLDTYVKTNMVKFNFQYMKGCKN